MNPIHFGNFGGASSASFLEGAFYASLAAPSLFAPSTSMPGYLSLSFFPSLFLHFIYSLVLCLFDLFFFSFLFFLSFFLSFLFFSFLFFYFNLSFDYEIYVGAEVLRSADEFHGELLQGARKGRRQIRSQELRAHPRACTPPSPLLIYLIFILLSL